MTTEDDDKARRLRQKRAQLAGYMKNAKMTPDERRAHMQMMSRKSSEARARRRAEQGLPEPRKSNSMTRSMPSPEELGEFMDLALAQYPTASELALRRQAVLLRRQHLARIEFEQARKEGQE